jgi:putative NIF3 family GTP cyclohydrolase 1 type 2
MNTLKLLDELTDKVRTHVVDLGLVHEVLNRLPETEDGKNLPAYVRVQALVSAYVQLQKRITELF